MMSTIQECQETKQNMRRAHTRACVLWILAGACSSAGCADERATNTNDEVQEGPAFVLSTRIWDDLSTNSYFHVLPSLDEDAVVDPAAALEVPGSARLFAFEDVGWFGIGDGEAPIITRYTLERGELVATGEPISFQPFGVQSLWDTMYYVSPTKAYYPDRAGEQLVIWNPTEMKVEGRLELPETSRDGYLALYGYGSVRRGKTLLFSVAWVDWNSTDTTLPETGLVAVDTETDTVARIDVDDRCGGITTPIEMDSGDAYFLSSAIGSAAHQLDRMETEPCALRVLADAEGFDADYNLPLSELTGGATAGDPIPDGRDGLFFRVFDESLATIVPETKTYEITGQSAWHWWHWDIATNEAAVISDLAPSPANVAWFDVDGSVYTFHEASGSTESTLIELTAEGGPKRGLTIPGFLHAMKRVQ